MRFDGNRLLVVSVSAAAAAGVEQLIVTTARRLRYGPGGSASEAQRASWSHRWAHLILTEALATVQAEIVDRRLRASVAVDRAIAQKQHGEVRVPHQRDPARSSTGALQVPAQASPSIRDQVAAPGPRPASGAT